MLIEMKIFKHIKKKNVIKDTKLLNTGLFHWHILSFLKVLIERV